MVAKIKSGKSLIGALNYNENKVREGKAELIATNGYAKNDEALSFHDKLFRLTDLAGRNQRAKTNTVHLSLNFDISEKLDNDKLVFIADEYMKRIGFEHQPYLIYKHTDAGHLHTHIVTTNIQADGKRISLNNIGLLKSEPARKAIEIAYGLVKASERKNVLNGPGDLKIKPVLYGKSDTKRSITNIVNEVARSFKYTSLPEFNAILGLYNVVADRGSAASVMFKKGGLQYWVTDQQGRKVGVPIKASSIYSKPILKLLEGRFKLNEYLRKPLKEQLKYKIGQAMAKANSLEELSGTLKKAGITSIIRQNSEGRVYGLSYIDHGNKVVFNGSDLGKTYSASAVVNGFRFRMSDSKLLRSGQAAEKTERFGAAGSLIVNNPTGRTLLDEFLNPNEMNQSIPHQLMQTKRKKKRRKLNL
jgi:hypothetical protein